MPAPRTKTYQVTLPQTFEAPRRHRAGIMVIAGPVGYIGPLSAEQLAAIKADPVLYVKTIKGAVEDIPEVEVPETAAAAAEVPTETPDVATEAPAE